MKRQKSPLAVMIFFILIVSGCNEKDESIEIFFDPDVSSKMTNIGLPVTFTDYSTGVVSRNWTFPGGSPETSTEQEVSVAFSQVGLIKCMIKNSFIDGIEESKDIFIQVGSGLINYDVSSVQANAGESITFIDYSQSVASRKWTFPGGNPRASTQSEIIVSFDQEGPITCTLEVTFENNITDKEEISIQIGTELYPRSVFGFEDQEYALDVWQAWVSNGSDAMVFSLENELGGGANDTDGYVKIEINSANIESQFFTKGVEGFPNARLESNKTYEFSFWVKSNDFNTITAAEVTNESELQTWHNFAWYSPIPEVGSDWSFKTVTFQTGDLTQIYSEGRANNAWTQFKFIQPGTGIIYIDEISLKEIE